MNRFSGLGDLGVENPTGRAMALSENLADVPLNLCEKIYYGEGSSHYKENCDTIRSTKYVQSFTSLATNGSSNLQIPNVSILDQIFISVGLPIGAIPVNVYLVRAWLLLMIDRIEWQLGSSSRYVQDSASHLQYLLEQAQESNVKDAVLRLAGNSQNVPNTATIDVSCPICLPFTRGLYGDKKHPFDLKMLSLPCNVTVYFKSNGLAAVAGGTGIAGLPTSWTYGYFTVAQLDFKDPNYSLAKDLQLAPMTSYIQPSLFIQNSINVPITSSSSQSAPIPITLTGIRYGNLTSIGILVVRNADITGNGSQPPNPGNFQQLQNMNLVFNGVTLLRAQNRIMDLQYLSKHHTPNFFQYETASTLVSPFVLNGFSQSYYYTIDLSQCSDIVDEGSIQSGLEVGSSTMNLFFTTPNSNGEACTAYIAYRYPFGLKISNGGGSTELVF